MFQWKIQSKSFSLSRCLIAVFASLALHPCPVSDLLGGLDMVSLCVTETSQEESHDSDSSGSDDWELISGAPTPDSVRYSGSIEGVEDMNDMNSRALWC